MRHYKQTKRGLRNTASGSLALISNTGGIDNTASGYEALRTNDTGVIIRSVELWHYT